MSYPATKDLHTNDDVSLMKEESHISRQSKFKIQALSKWTRCGSGIFGPCIAAPLLTELAGEFIGTFFAVLVIITVGAIQTLFGADVGLWQVAVVSGLGVGLSIYATAHFSNSHFNPAVTLAFALVRWRAFSWKKLVPYIAVQIFAGFVSGSMLYAMYWNAIALYEQNHNITRGTDASVSSAMIFGEYFPNPGFNAFQNDTTDAVSPAKAMAIEAWATGILVFMIFSFSDPNNSTVGSKKSKVAIPVLIGLTVSVLISLYAPLTQAGMNPARDFGPRLFAATAGWGRIAIPGPRNGFWVYIVGPLIGGPIGGAIYDWVVARFAKPCSNFIDI